MCNVSVAIPSPTKWESAMGNVSVAIPSPTKWERDQGEGPLKSARR
jgi:hypothetical protein